MGQVALKPVCIVVNGPDTGVDFHAVSGNFKDIDDHTLIIRMIDNLSGWRTMKLNRHLFTFEPFRQNRVLRIDWAHPVASGYSKPNSF